MSLDESDFLTYQLYTASKSPRVRKARIRGWISVTFTFAILSYLFYRSNSETLEIYFLVCAGIALIFYPFYSRWRYKRHYLNYVRDTYKNRIGEKGELEFTEETIGVKSPTGEVKIGKTEIIEINEINDHYFIKSRSGVTFIVSKTKSDNIDSIRSEIKLMVDTFGVKHNMELDWRWR